MTFCVASGYGEDRILVDHQLFVVSNTTLALFSNANFFGGKNEDGDERCRSVLSAGGGVMTILLRASRAMVPATAFPLVCRGSIPR